MCSYADCTLHIPKVVIHISSVQFCGLRPSLLLPTRLSLAASRFADLVISNAAKHRLTSYDPGPAVTEDQQRQRTSYDGGCHLLTAPGSPFHSELGAAPGHLIHLLPSPRWHSYLILHNSESTGIMRSLVPSSPWG